METIEQAMAVVIMKHRLRLDYGDRRVMIANLQFAFHLMRASEPLLRTAVWETASWVTKLEDPYSIKLLGYYQRHFEEERDHAAWLAEDLATAGVVPRFIDTPLQAAEIAGSQYYLIIHVHPAALLGYLAALEYFPKPVEFWDELAVIHGPALLRTMRFHSEADGKHGQELRELIAVTPDMLRGLIHRNGVNITERLLQAAHTFKQED